MGPGHDQKSPDELMENDSNGQIEVKSDFAGPNGGRNQKQPEPENSNNKMYPEKHPCKK